MDGGDRRGDHGGEGSGQGHSDTGLVSDEVRDRVVRVAVTQFSCSDDQADNIARAVCLVREAKSVHGAHIVVLQELFSSTYFPQAQDDALFDRAETYESSPLLASMSRLARELQVVLPVSFFEKSGNSFFNSVCVLDADGARLGLYRKSHIPQGPGYEEKFYFSPGDTGFQVFQTRYARLGVGICWDQWFPETARALVLKGAELLVFPTAIGSEPQDPSLNSLPHWRAAMFGHAACNMVPVVASNRVGTEAVRHYHGGTTQVTFYGGSFICGPEGQLATADLGAGDMRVAAASFDLDQTARQRRAWGLFRDRRPDLYGPLLTLDGRGHEDESARRGAGRTKILPD